MTATPEPQPDEQLDTPCDTCGEPMGGHTLRQLKDVCMAHLNYHLPYEDNPNGPQQVDPKFGDMVGAVDIAAAVIESAIGRHPGIRFSFTGPGPEPGTTRTLPPITLIMDATSLRTLRQLVSTAIDKAILAARRGR